jgi:Ribbon-helix-helix protein, copG family
MEAKIRKQIYLDRQQDEILKQTSRKLGVSEAEIIRRAIISQASRLSISQRNRKAWEKEYQFIQSLVKQGKVQGKRKWKREDLYDR